MDVVPVFAAQQELRIHAILDHIRRAPLAGNGDVMSQVPREIIAKILRAPIDFPSAERIETVMIKRENSSGTIAIGRAESAYVDAVGPAMNGVWAAVASPFRQVFCLDHFHDLRLLRVVLGIDDMDPRRTQPRYDQISPLDMRVRSVGTQRGTACVPAEMMKLVSHVRDVAATHDLAI